MINLTLLREEPERIMELIKRKDPSFDCERLYELDEKCRSMLSEIELLRKRKMNLPIQAKQELLSN